MPAGVSIDKIHYKITGPGSYTKTGDIPVGGSGTTFSAKIDGIPADDGYTLKLDAVEAGGSTKCMGSADFSVVANAVTAVSVRLQCPGMKGGGNGDTGSVMVNGTINICAVAQNATATPSADGTTLALVGVGSDEDDAPAPITYKWTATKGTLTGSDMANVTLSCPVGGGSVDIVFEVSDTDCGDKIQLTGVPCGNGSGGSGGSGAGGDSGGAGAGGAGAGGAGTGGAGAGGAGAGGAGAGGAGAGGAGAGGAGAGGAGAGGAGAGGAGAGGAGAGGAGAGGDSGGAGAGGAGAGGAGAGGAGAGGAGAGGSGGGSSLPGGTAACTACRQTNCTNYNQLGFNLVTGCFQTVDPQFGASASDPMFIQQCVSLMSCAYTKKCGFTVELGASECYCGTASLDTCFATATAPNGPCMTEFTDAARTTVQTDVSVRVSDLAYPLGWANYLLECDTTLCGAMCKPQ